MTEQDVYNLNKTYELISKHFSLSDNGLKKVKERMYDPYSFVNSPIKTLFNNSPDGRVRFEVPVEFMSDSDQGWHIFRRSFLRFVTDFGITYENFRNNKVLIEKNEIKLKKALVKYYTERPEAFDRREIVNVTSYNEKSSLMLRSSLEKIDALSSILRRFDSDDKEDLIEWVKNIDMENIADSFNFKKIPTSLRKLIDLSYSSFEDINILNEKKNKDILSKLIEEVIRITMEVASQYKIPRSDLEVVFSRNFADWFLCSTEENWSSCLSLKSNYHACFWSGIPGLLGDPNRIMIYVTDGSKKEYKGIKTDRFISRAWGLYSEDNEFNVTRWYDQKKIKHKDICNFSGWPIRPRTGEDFRSLDPLDPIYFENGQSSFIYIDNGYITREGGEFYLIGDSGNSDAYTIEDGEIESNPPWSLSVSEGLEDLISCNSSLQSFNDRNKEPCEHCGDMLDTDNDEYYTTHDVYTICSDCFHSSHGICDHTSEIYHNDELTTVYNGERINDSTLDNEYTNIDGEYYPDNEVVTVFDEFEKMEIIHESKLEGNMILSKFHEGYIPEEHSEYICSEDDYYLIRTITKIRERAQLDLIPA